MLRVGLDKLRGRALDRRITLVRGDATAIPVRDGWADAATIGFGIRNVAQPEAALAELARVIKPGGRLLILEFGEPIIPGIRAMYNWYFRVVLPQLGRLVSKHQSAYSYLPGLRWHLSGPGRVRRHHFFTRFYRRPARPLTLGHRLSLRRDPRSLKVASRTDFGRHSASDIAIIL